MGLTRGMGESGASSAAQICGVMAGIAAICAPAADMRWMRRER